MLLPVVVGQYVLLVVGSVSCNVLDDVNHFVTEFVVSANAVSAVLARECMVKVYVVGGVAGVGRGCSVTWCQLVRVWFVESHFGGGHKFFIREWYDVFDGCVEPSASPYAAAGVVDTHSPGIQFVGEFPEASVSDE